MHHREGADQRHRHGGQRDDRGAPGLEEKDHDQHHEQDRLDQRVDDRLDRAADEDRRVVDDVVVEPVGKILLQLDHRGAHLVGDVDRVGAGHLEDRHRHRDAVVEQRAQRVFGGAEFDAGQVAEMDELAVRTGLDDDGGEFLLGGEATLGVDEQLGVDRGARGLLADATGGDLDVLLANGGDDVGGGQALGRDLVWVEPHAHRVVTGTKKLDLADAGQAGDRVLHLDRRVVADVDLVVAVVRREQVHDHREVGRALDRGDTEAADFLGQLGLRLGNAVLHLHLGVVQIGADLERDGERHHAVARRLRRHVERVLHAVDRLLERRGDRLGDGLGIGARVDRADDDRRRHDFRVFAHRQAEERDRADEEDDDREHAGEDRSLDEKIGDVHGRWQFLGKAVAGGAAARRSKREGVRCQVGLADATSDPA